jgi:peroxiredoxin
MPNISRLQVKGIPKGILILLTVIVLCASCQKDKGKVVIKGSIEKIEGQYLYLQELKIGETGKTDSLFLDEKGKFTFTKVVHHPTFYTLFSSINPNDILTLLVHPGDRVRLSGDGKNLFGTYQVRGSRESVLVQELTRKTHESVLAVDSLNRMLQVYANNPNIVNIRRQLEYSFFAILDSTKDYLIAFIQKHPTSMASLLAVYQQIAPETYVFSEDDDLQYFKMVDSALFREYPRSPHVKALRGNVKEMTEQLRLAEITRMFAGLGTEAPEISLPSPEGKIIKLSSLRGKHVLLDFWASWCKPCRDENPVLVENYQKFKHLGLEIYQVSIDQSKNAWIKAIEDDQLDWVHVSDLLYWDSPVVELYNIESIPANLLLDPDGIIIAKNLRGDELGKKLESILSPSSQN